MCTGACLAPCSRPVTTEGASASGVPTRWSTDADGEDQACRSVHGEYAAAAAAVRRVLEGHGDDLDERLQGRQASMVQALAFEQAARLQKQREALERALRTVHRLQAAQRDDAVVVYPAKRAGWIALWGVRGGRVAVERSVGRAAFGEPPLALLEVGMAQLMLATDKVHPLGQ